MGEREAVEECAEETGVDVRPTRGATEEEGLEATEGGAEATEGGTGGGGMAEGEGEAEAEAEAEAEEEKEAAVAAAAKHAGGGAAEAWGAGEWGTRKIEAERCATLLCASSAFQELL